MTGVGSLPHPIALPHPPKMASVKALPKAPKIAAVKIHPVSNGFKVTHVIHGGKNKLFVFQNPARMVSHLKRIEATEWLKPGSNPAPRITNVLDLGAEA